MKLELVEITDTDIKRGLEILREREGGGFLEEAAEAAVRLYGDRWRNGLAEVFRVDMLETEQIRESLDRYIVFHPDQTVAESIADFMRERVEVWLAASHSHPVRPGKSRGRI